MEAADRFHRAPLRGKLSIPWTVFDGLVRVPLHVLHYMNEKVMLSFRLREATSVWVDVCDP